MRQSSGQTRSGVNTEQDSTRNPHRGEGGPRRRVESGEQSGEQGVDDSVIDSRDDQIPCTSVDNPVLDTSTLTMQLAAARAERDNAVTSFNDYKEKYNKMEQLYHNEKLTNKILLKKIEKNEEDINVLQQERDGLARLNADLKVSMSPKQNNRFKFLERISKTMEDKFVSLAVVVDTRILKWAQMETMEIFQDADDVKHRNWDGRMTKVPKYGLPSQGESGTTSFQFVPLLVSEVISSMDVFYLRSYSSVESVLAALTTDVLKEEAWYTFGRSPQLVSDAVTAVSTDKTMISRVKQSLTDTVSNRKRSVRDELFCMLRYYSLKSSHDRRTDKPIFSKVEEISKAQSKLLPQEDGDNPDLTAWRTRSLQSLSSDGIIHPTLVGRDFREDKPEEYDDDRDNIRDKTAEDREYCFTSLGIFTNSIGFNLWSIFIGFDPYESDTTVTEVSFFTIPRLDAWIATTIQLLEENEKRGGGRQKKYNINFTSNMKLATYSLITTIYNFTKYWIPSELTIPHEVPGGDYKDYVLNKVEREGTILLYSERTRTYYIALTATWFRDYISSNCGVIHDCFIAMVARDWKSIIPISKENCGVLVDDDNGPDNPEYIDDDNDDDKEDDPPAPPTIDYQEDNITSRMDVDPLPKSV